jgi:hypothetical protein
VTRYIRRKDPGPGENLRAGLVAGALAVATAAVSFYLVRLVLSREPLEPLEGGTAGEDPTAGREDDGA